MPKRQGQLIVDSQATGGSVSGTISGIGGSGSGLDADKLDGLHATAFLLADGSRAVSSLTPVRLVASDSGKLLASVADLTDWIAGTAGTVTVTDNGDGTLTLDLDDPLSVASLIVNEDGTATGDLRAESDTEPNMLFLDASADTLYLGGTTNGVQVAAGGMLTLHGSATVYEDVRLEPITRSTGVNAAVFSQWFTDGSTSRGVYLYTFDNAVTNSQKEVHFTIQMPHAWAQTPIHLHVHWIAATTAASSKVRWGLEYTWAEPGAVFGNTTLVYADTDIYAATGVTAHAHTITEFADLTPTATQDGFSSILICRLWRDSGNAADTYTGDVGVLYIDAHVEMNKLGSNDEYS